MSALPKILIKVFLSFYFLKLKKLGKLKIIKKKIFFIDCLFYDLNKIDAS